VLLKNLPRADLQRLAIERSKQVDVTAWFDRLAERQAEMRSGTTDHVAIEGILHRLRPFRYGQLAQMYGRGEGSIAVEDLAFPWGVVVLEGGTMGEVAKAMVLGLLAWHIYQDSIFRREETMATRDQIERHPMFLVFEEANKIISGVGGKTDEPFPIVSDIYATMFRDGRKYNCFLAVIGQSPAALPTGDREFLQQHHGRQAQRSQGP